jgi:hypothetical protein
VDVNRTIKIALKDFPSLPPSLCAQFSSSTLADEVEIDLGRLFHHFYLDTQGTPPPDPDAAQFHHLRLLAATKDFRARGLGFGTHAAFRGHVSNELGQAFCRWFLYEHLDVTYFAHMEHVLDRGAQKAFGNARVERVQKGDAPDYLCAGSAGEPFLAEASLPSRLPGRRQFFSGRISALISALSHKRQNNLIKTDLWNSPK